MKYVSENVFTDGDKYIDMYSFYRGMDYMIQVFDNITNASNKSMNVEKLQRELRRLKNDSIKKAEKEGGTVNIPMKKQMKC